MTGLVGETVAVVQLTQGQRRWLVDHGRYLVSRVSASSDPHRLFIGRGHYLFDLFAAWTLLAEDTRFTLGRNIVARKLLEVGNDLILGLTDPEGYTRLAQARFKEFLQDSKKVAREASSLGLWDMGLTPEFEIPVKIRQLPPVEAQRRIQESGLEEGLRDRLAARNGLIGRLSHEAAHATITALMRHVDIQDEKVATVQLRIRTDPTREEEFIHVDALVVGVVGAVVSVTQGEESRLAFMAQAESGSLPSLDELGFRAPLLSPLRERMQDLAAQASRRSPSSDGYGWLASQPLDVLFAAATERFYAILDCAREVLGIGAEAGFLELVPSLVETAAFATVLTMNMKFLPRALESDAAFRSKLHLEPQTWKALHVKTKGRPKRLPISTLLELARVECRERVGGENGSIGQKLFGLGYIQAAGQSDTYRYTSRQVELFVGEFESFQQAMNTAASTVDLAMQAAEWMLLLDRLSPAIEIRVKGQ